ncbi:hypothetical protein D3C86_2208010 [compost metagenome]
MAEGIPRLDQGSDQATAGVDRQVLHQPVIGRTQRAQRPAQHIVLVEEIEPLEARIGLDRLDALVTGDE